MNELEQKVYDATIKMLQEPINRGLLGVVVVELYDGKREPKTEAQRDFLQAAKAYAEAVQNTLPSEMSQSSYAFGMVLYLVQKAMMSVKK